MKNVIDALQRRQPVDLGHRGPQGLRAAAGSRTPAAVGLQVRGRLAVGDHQHDRLGVGVPAQVPAGQQQRVVQVGALLPGALQPDQLAELDLPGVAART